MKFQYPPTALLLFGPLSCIGRHGEAFYPNQSFNGVLNRLLFNGSNLEWRYYEYAPVNAFVVAGTIAAFIVFVALSLWPPDKRTALPRPG